MSTNISAYGLQARLVASNSFPAGFDITAFADDADPLESPDFAAADTAMGVNGDMVVWSRPSAIEIATAVIPSSVDDFNLDALLEANRVGKGKKSARDSIQIVWTYPNGQVVTATSGAIISAPLIMPVASAGRFKSRVYRFRFENVSKSGGAPVAQ